MKQTKSNFIIATIKPWNIANFKKYLGKKRNIYLISKNQDLTYERIHQINPGYIFFPHWSWIIPKQIWKKFTCIVFHMTDLPYGR